MSAYSRGMVLERRVVHTLEADGYYVISAKGSKGVADHIAIKAGQILVVQDKLTDRLDPEPWNALVDLADRIGGLPIFVHRDGRNLVWWRLTGRKVPRGAAPREPWTADEVAA
jgi:Holliday junction resolvase